MQDPQTSYFSQWTISEYEDTSNTFDFIRRFSYHRFSDNKVTTIKKVYKTTDPHYKITINVDILLYHYESQDITQCYGDQTQGHLRNPFCSIQPYDWAQGEDFILLKIDGKPYKIDNFDQAVYKYDRKAIPFSIIDLPHTRETLTVEFIPFNNKWNLYTIIEDLYIYYEVCDDKCLCLSCSVDGKCQKCDNSQYFNASSQKCESCAANCFNCTTASDCISCIDGYYLNSTTNICEDQTTHQGEVGIEGVWVAPPSLDCDIWDKSGTCIVKKVIPCPDGQFGDSCQYQCDSFLGCQSCSQKVSCNQCVSNKPYYYNQICSEECKQQGYYKKSATECGKCDFTCVTCSGPLPTDCLTCETSKMYYKDDTKECISCTDTYYPNDITNQCELCSDKVTNCQNCINLYNQPLCLECQSSFYLFEDQCYPDCTQFPNTKKIESLKQCIYCYEGCLSCDDFIINKECTQCAPGYFKYQNMCLLSCDNILGYYPNLTIMQCLKCQDFNCDVCLGEGRQQCQQCGEYTVLSQDQTCKLCGSKQAYVQFQRICIDCPNNCEHCISPSICLSCDDGYFLDSQQPNQPCVSTCSGLQFKNTVTKKCEKCAKGTVKNMITGLCDNCDDGCEQCESNGKCDKCFPGYILNACNATKQCTKCPFDNQYSVGSSQSCFTCDPVCKTCRGPGNLMCDQCVDGYFKANLYCLQCYKSCKTCNSTQKCIECAAGYPYVGYKSPQSKQKYVDCYQSCPPTQNTDEQNKICYNCDPTCQTCSGPLENQCITCKDIGFYRQYLTFDNRCVLQCPIKTYADSTLGKCLDCDLTCLQCNSSTQFDCTVCADGRIYRQVSKLCVTQCPDGEYHDIPTNTCKKCLDICKTCNESGKCASCESPLYVSSDEKSCVSNCLPTEYRNDTLMICIKCSLNCIECSSTTVCQLCAQSFLLQDGKCVTNCSDGYYLSTTGSTNQCLPCETDCQICTESKCLKCEFKNLFIYGKNCVAECPKDYVKDNGQCVLIKDSVKEYMDCYVDCEKEKEFSDNSDVTVKGIELSQASMNGFSLFFGGLGNYFFYWLQMQQILGNMVFLQNTRALGIGSLHLKTLYMENLFNLIPIAAPEEDIMKAFVSRSDGILQDLHPQNIYVYFVQNCQYSLMAILLSFLIVPILFLLSKDIEFFQLLYLYCKWNVVIRLIMISSNFLLLCTFIKFKQSSFSGSLTIADFISMAGFLIIYILTFSLLIHCNNSTSIDNRTLRTINAFYYDIDTTTTIQKHFWVIFEARKFIVCILIVSTDGHMIVPWIYLCLCIGFLIYCFKIVPFSKVILHRYVLIAEIINILCVLCLSFVVTLHDQAASVYFAYAFIILLIIYQLWSLLTQIYQLISLLITLFLKYRLPAGSPRQERNRNLSTLPFLLKGRNDQNQDIIRQINVFDLTDMKNVTECESPKKKRETQGTIKIHR